MKPTHAMTLLLVFAACVAPADVRAAPTAAATATATAAQPGTLTYTTWTAQNSDQKAAIVAGDMDGIVTGYFEPLIIVSLTSGLTGNKDVTTIANNLDKTVPAFSKKPAEYVPSIDAIYARPETRKLSVGNILACLADRPYGAPNTTTDDCIKTFL